MKRQWPYFLIAFVLPVSVVLWWWGLFSSASLQVAERGPYHYAYLEAQGPYSKLVSKQKEVLFALEQQNIEAGAEVTLVLSDPRTTPYKELHARTGYLIAEGVMPLTPLKVDTIPPRAVAVASIKAHPLFAYGKTYSALLDFAGQNNIALHLPTLEIVHDSVLSVEMPMAIDQTSTRHLRKDPGAAP